MSARITKNELVAINATLAAENAALRAQLSAAKVQRNVASKGTASGVRRALASFWELSVAGKYIAALKQRGCKLPLTAVRDERGHFVVFAG